MATTAILVKKEGLEKRLLFMTASSPTGVDVDIFLGDENFLPIGRASIGVDLKSEEDYHRQLRKESSEKGHFVREHSTNPEWNPAYVAEEN